MRNNVGAVGGRRLRAIGLVAVALRLCNAETHDGDEDDEDD